MSRIAGDRLSAEKLRELARVGAEHALRRVRTEIVALERAFPELKLRQGRHAMRKSIQETRRGTRRMSAEARKAVSERMTRYWAERRKAKAKVK